MARKAKSEQVIKSKLEKSLESEKVSKTTKKPSNSKKTSLFIDVAPDKYFVLCDGKTVKDYAELASLLETVNDDIYYYHVTPDRNDFANWVNDVFGEEKLADDIRNSRNKTEMMATIYKHLFTKISGLMK